MTPFKSAQKRARYTETSWREQQKTTASALGAAAPTIAGVFTSWRRMSAKEAHRGGATQRRRRPMDTLIGHERHDVRCQLMLLFAADAMPTAFFVIFHAFSSCCRHIFIFFFFRFLHCFRHIRDYFLPSPHAIPGTRLPL